MPVEELKQKTIRKIKKIKAEQCLSIAQIMDMMEKRGQFVSERTLKKVFADGSEEQNFRYQDSIAPIADVLLDIYDDSAGLDDIESMRRIIKEKNKYIEFLMIKLDENESASERQDKIYDDRKAAYERTISSLESQLHRLHEQVDRDYQMISQLLAALLEKG